MESESFIRTRRLFLWLFLHVDLFDYVSACRDTILLASLIKLMEII